MPKIVVCGGRDYADRAAVFRALDALHWRRPIELLVHGGAGGADALAAEWAASRRVRVEVFPADWKKYGRGAGPQRNRQMAAAGADLLVAFEGGKGTADMCRRAAGASIPVWHPDSAVSTPDGWRIGTGISGV